MNIFLSFCAALFVCAHAHAAAFFYTVTGTADNTDSTTHGGNGTAGSPFQMSSLRGATIAANSNPGSTIILPAGTYSLTIPGDANDRNWTGSTAQAFNPNIGDLDIYPTGITIKGAGAGVTIIQQTTGADRIMTVNPNSTIGLTFTLSDLTLRGGRDTSLNHGGGAIFLGAKDNVSTIANCVFLDNKVTAAASLGGGAVQNTGGNLLVTNCTFGGVGASDPNASSTSGGAIGYDSSDFVNAGGVGTLTVINSVFIRNTAGSSAAGGGAIQMADSNLSTAHANIIGCTFTNNQATNATGGAIVAETGTLNVTNCTFLNNFANTAGGAISGSGNGTIARYSRFIGNTAGVPANGNTLNAQTASFNADDNWWGVNTGPNVNDLRNTTVTTWLQLRHAANPNTIFIPNSTTLTATFLTNSAGTFIPVANLSRLIGLPITFNNAVRGSLSGAQTTIQSSGTATATFTANVAGAGSANAVVDNQATTATITIPTGVSSINRVQTTPTNLASVQWVVTFTNAVTNVTAGNFNLVNTGLGGSPAITSVTPAALATLTNQWTVTASTGSGTGTLGLNMVNGTGVSAVIVNLPFTGQVYTIDLVPPNTSITAQPPAITNGTSASFSFTGSDTGVGVASFQCRLDGGSFVDCTSPVSFTGLSDGSHTFDVRAIDGVGNIDASPATVTWTVDTTPPSIAISAPSAPTLHFGGFASFTVTYMDTHFNSSTLVAGNVTINKTGSADGSVVVSGSGTTRTVTITNVSGSGTIGISIAAGTATDTAGNLAPAAGPSATFEVVQDDFGDAPAPYPTLLAGNGARHAIPVGGATLYLGVVAPDGESDGQPNSTATGDDVAGTDDEGGVALPLSFRAALASNLTVTVTGSGGLLNAWIDWNNDGDWNDAGEQIATNRAMSAGANVIAVFAPTNTVSATSFARFRLSTQSGLLPTGQANDGEVEDYAVTLVSNTPPVAVTDTLGTRQNRAVSMAAFKLVSNDTDVDGDVLSVIGVTATSTNGGSVMLASGMITYTPLAALTNADRFTYTNSDGRGGMATGVVLVTLTSTNLVSGNVVFGPAIQGSEFVVRFAGIPGTNYTIEAADTLTPPVPWTKKVNKAAPTDNSAGFGIGVFEFREAHGGVPQRFYRTVFPAY